MDIANDQARIELARRELARRELARRSSAQSSIPDFYERQGTDEESIDLAKQQISEQYPNMPNWLRDAILSMTPKEKSPLLESAAKGITDVTNYIPAAFGGALQGASLPIRGVAGLIPTEFTQKLANSPDLRDLFPNPEGFGQETVQMGGELLGAGGLLGKLFGVSKALSVASKVPKALQTPLSLAVTGAVATPGGAEDRGMGALGGLLLGGAGNIASKAGEKAANKLPAFFRGLTTKATPESLIEAAQRPHDVLQQTANDLYGQVRSEIEKRGIKIPVKEDYLAQAEEILPKTRASRKLIDKAKSGDYEAIHDLQSHLYKKGTKGLASNDIALENQGEEIIDLRNKINDALEQHLLKNGHLDIAHILRQGKKTYATLMDTYFHKNLPKGIGKLVHPEMRLVPENPEKLFSQKSVPMKRFLEQHPDVAKHAKELKEKEEAEKTLKSLFIKGGATGGVTYGVKSIYDLFK